ncbi:MAG: hypothetical protein IPI31_03060 [Bacteroidetes bacterium]|nr:hypothetical protein [Bacteroidota bacterium]
MTAYIISIITALVFLLLSIFIANAIKFEGGSNPKDPGKRKMWFWILAILNPAINFSLGYFLFMPKGNIMVVDKYVSDLSIATGAGFVLYIIIGFILSKMFKNGKLGHWF